MPFLYLDRSQNYSRLTIFLTKGKRVFHLSILSSVRLGDGYAAGRISYEESSTYRPCHTHYVTVLVFFISVRTYNISKFSWLRVWMSYHRFSNLAELLNGDLAAKIGRGIFSKDLMDRKFNCSLPYKVNGKCVYEGKCWSICIIYEAKYSICEAIYIDNTHQTFKKIMDGHF